MLTTSGILEYPPDTLLRGSLRALTKADVAAGTRAPNLATWFTFCAIRRRAMTRDSTPIFSASAIALACFLAAFAIQEFQESVILLLFPLWNAGATVVSLDSGFRPKSTSTITCSHKQRD